MIWGCLRPLATSGVGHVSVSQTPPPGLFREGSIYSCVHPMSSVPCAQNPGPHVTQLVVGFSRETNPTGSRFAHTQGHMHTHAHASTYKSYLRTRLLQRRGWEVPSPAASKLEARESRCQCRRRLAGARAARARVSPSLEAGRDGCPAQAARQGEAPLPWTFKFWSGLQWSGRGRPPWGGPPAGPVYRLGCYSHR